MITWSITSLERILPTDLVLSAQWECIASNDTDMARIYGIQSIPYDESTQTIPYDQLTQDVVLGWVKDSIGIENVARLEENVQSILDAPKIVSSVPW